MNYKIVIIDEAKLDYKEALNYYKDINPKLGKRFNQSFKDSLDIIKKKPELFQIRFENVRIKMLKTFPYLIHFAIYDNLIVIKAIYHSSRNSKLNLF
jgi:hypothetical protein